MYKELTNVNIEISYEDYNVEAFGGGDYEVIYTLTKENGEKLRNILVQENKESNENLTLKELILKRFGPNLENESFAEYCDNSNIKYDLQTYIH
jgi:hypothetical protein